MMGSRFGLSVCGLRDDVNEDDVPDFAVAAPGEKIGADRSVGQVYLFSGKTGKLLQTLKAPDPSRGINFGEHIDAIADRDDDCVNDLLISDRSGGEARGRAHIYSSQTGELIETINPETRLDVEYIDFPLSIMRDAIGQITSLLDESCHMREVPHEACL